MSLPGPSSLGRVDACITSEALPHARATNEFSERGDAIHAFLAACVNMGRDVALLRAPDDERAMFEAIPVDRLPPLDPSKYVAEVSFALDVRDGKCRELGRGLSREQARALATEYEMVGTADLGGVTADAFVLHDWKTGHGHVDAAEVNKQTRTYALMGARAYARERAVGSIIRILDDGTVWYDRFEMDSMELDAHEADIRRLMEERAVVLGLPPDERPALHEGRHCKYCPALPFCPAKMALLRTAFEDETTLAKEVVELTPERAAKAWLKLEAAGQLIERLLVSVKEYAKHHPFEIGDGYVVSEVEEAKETIIPVRAKPVLERQLGPELGGVVYVSSATTKTSMTKDALRSALRQFVLPTLPKGEAKITKVEEAILDRLREGGAISVAAYTHVKERKLKKGEVLKALPQPAEQPPPPSDADAQFGAEVAS